ncbi:DUF992 domain-containing protein [Aurantimonas sp. A2-1-M11]|uniref:DUF992 domain-containing protein n=1 Tax=Aurantimonas sp. A2-1-M11 TaxID=3113712 RepID=UPI002F956EF0
MISRISSLAIAAALTAAPFAVSSAQAEVNAGVLGCHSDGATGFIIGSSEKLVCEFTPADNGPVELYAATLDTFGLDVGVTGRTVMTWAVVTADGFAYQPNGLAGTYVGATVDASAIVGGGANVLVGGSQDSYSLQPISIQAQEGINAAIGVSKFTLTPAEPVVTAPATVAVPAVPAGPGEVRPK